MPQRFTRRFSCSRSCDTIFIQCRQIQPVRGREKHRLKIIRNFWSQESTMTLTDAILYITLFCVALITISVVAAPSRFGTQHVCVTLLASEHAHTHRTHRGTQKAHVCVSPDETRVKLTVAAKPGGSCSIFMRSSRFIPWNKSATWEFHTVAPSCDFARQPVDDAGLYKDNFFFSVIITSMLRFEQQQEFRASLLLFLPLCLKAHVIAN